MGFVATLLMLLGVYIVCRYINSKNASGKLGGQKSIVYLTGGAIISRAAIMPIIDYEIFFRFLFPIFLGYSLPESYIVGLIPVLILFNIITSLYTIPIAYAIATRVKKIVKMETGLIK